MRPDRILSVIARYTAADLRFDREAMTMARYCLMDALGCALQALDSAESTLHVGPVVPGTVVPNGARVPSTGF